mgnify:CR=1 FL=1
MKFKDLSIYLQKLENTQSRNDMILILSELFEKVPTEDIGKVMYLLQGRVAPLYVNLEFGMADKMILKAISILLQGGPTGKSGFLARPLQVRNRDVRCRSPRRRWPLRTGGPSSSCFLRTR